jgi:cell division protein FtsQ
MPAAVRGGSRAAARPPSKAPPKARAPQSARRGPAAPPHEHHGLSPKWALIGASAVLVLALGAALATGRRGERLVATVGVGIDARFGDMGFRLKTVAVTGASRMATADIVKAAGVYQDQPLLGLDLDGVRRKIKAVGWVKDAKVVRLLPDTLVVSVIERRQLAVWQHGGRQYVIDEHGAVIPEADPARFAALPLVVGEGGAAHAPEILPVLAQRPRLIGQMDALVRVDDRRWDLRMKDGGLIQLPASGEEAALMQLERLDQRSRILELGFERIDLRNPDLVAVRPRATAPLAPQPAAAGA